MPRLCAGGLPVKRAGGMRRDDPYYDVARPHAAPAQLPPALWRPLLTLHPSPRPPGVRTGTPGGLREAREGVGLLLHSPPGPSLAKWGGIHPLWEETLAVEQDTAPLRRGWGTGRDHHTSAAPRGADWPLHSFTAGELGLVEVQVLSKIGPKSIIPSVSQQRSWGERAAEVARGMLTRTRISRTTPSSRGTCSPDWVEEG